MAKKIELIFNILFVSIMILNLLFSLIYLEKIKQHGHLKLFPLYTAVSLLITLPWFFKKIHFPGIFIQNIFIFFEFFIFYLFFIKVLKDRKSNFILIALSVLFFISIILVIAFIYNSQNSYSDLISFSKHTVFTEVIVIENIFIVIPVLFYYRALFNPPYYKRLSIDPIFLTMTGSLFCFGISTPFFVFSKLIWLQDNDRFPFLYMISTIGYIVMHLFFIKAYKSI